MTDDWTEIARRLGPAVGAEFRRRLDEVSAGDVSLHVAKHRNAIVRASVLPPPTLPIPALDAEDPKSAQSA